jgi:flagellar protein FlbD
MIHLTRLNHQEIAINCDLIEWAEAVPDTTVRLVSGECILVRESVEEVIRRIVDYRRSLLTSAGLASILTSGWRPSIEFLKRERGEATAGSPGGRPRLEAVPSPDRTGEDDEEGGR